MKCHRFVWRLIGFDRKFLIRIEPKLLGFGHIASPLSGHVLLKVAVAGDYLNLCVRCGRLMHRLGVRLEAVCGT